jgi:hypothetical protein
VIEHRVGHHVEIPPEIPHVLPPAEGGIDREEILHRETVVRGPRVEGQEVHPADQPPCPLVEKAAQHRERRFPFAGDLVAVGDEQGLGRIVETFRSGAVLLRFGPGRQLAGQRRAALRPVDEDEFLFESCFPIHAPHV